MWRWQTNELSKNFSVVTYDLIGHGESKDPEGKLDLEEFSEQILEIMKFLSIKKTALIGFSLGGMIARKFAIKYDEKLWALAVLNSAHKRDQKAKDAVQLRVNKVKIDGPQATTEDALNRWFTEEYRQNNPDVMNKIRNWVMENKKDVYPKAYQVLVDGVDELLDPTLPIYCPTIILTGDEDFGNSPQMSSEISKQIKGSELKILPGLRHMALIEDANTVNNLLVEFLLRNVH
jgi:pimeloyl-ACP methyl ester carboxylesterase